jgi:hypothetical protein
MLKTSERARTLVAAAGFLPLLKTGRWALVLIQGLLTLGLVAWYPSRPVGAYVAMALMMLYGGSTLLLVRRIPLEKLRIRSLIVLDFFFLTHVCYWTGGSNSPFLGLLYLLVLVSALFFDLWGGVLAGLAAGGIAIALTLLTPDALWELTRDTAPYFPIVGGFTGFVAGQMKQWQTKLQQGETEAQLQKRERELARSVQRSTQPELPPSLRGFTLAIRSVPSQEVGGDFYTFLTPRPGMLHVALGDVSGKGMAAALTATGIGYLLPHLRTQSPPEIRLAALNADLNARLPLGTFVALLYVALHEDGQVTFWNAGHVPPWRGARECSLGGAPPLGLFPDWRGPSQHLNLEPGETLLLCSDGVLEVRNASGDEFGPEGLSRFLAAHRNASSETIVDALLSAVHAHGDPADDLTVLVIRRAERRDILSL